MYASKLISDFISSVKNICLNKSINILNFRSFSALILKPVEEREN